MGYLKFIAYAYLAAGAFFIYSGIMALRNGEDSILMFILAALAIGMFFFRRHHAKKFGNRPKE